MYQLSRLLLMLTVLLFVYSVLLIASLIASTIPQDWWIVIIACSAFFTYKKRRTFSAFGTGRWASASDLRGMLDVGNGLIIGTTKDAGGKWAAAKALFKPSLPSGVVCREFLAACRWRKRGRLVRLNYAVHTAIFAPTGVGKGVSIVLPYLLRCPDSMVVVDYKGENAKISSRARRRMRHKVVVVDPFKVVTKTPDTFNPLELIHKDHPNALDDCRDLAAAIVVRTGQEKDLHWIDTAELWITAMIAMVVVFADPIDKSLQSVRDLLTDPKKMETAIQLMCGSTEWNGMLARLGHQLTAYKDKELSSTLTTTNRFLRFLDTMAIAESSKTSSFNPAELLKSKLTVYLVIPPEHMTAQAALLRLWVGSLLRAVVRGGLQEKKKVHFVLDESASLGAMDAITDAVDKYRGYGVRLLFLYQSLGQLKKCFPEGQDQTLLSNVTQTFFGVNDNETAKYVSERLGKETISIDSGGTSSGRSSQSSSSISYSAKGGGSSSSSSSSSRSSNTNNNWQQHGRELLQPDEVMNLPARTAVTFTPGVPPVWTTLVRYYERGFKRSPGWLWLMGATFLRALCYLIVMVCVAALLTRAATDKDSSAPGGAKAVQQRRSK